MSALSTFLAEVGDEQKARVENVDGKQVLYVVVNVFRQHLSTVTNLVHYHTEIDFALLVNRGREKIELHPIRHKE